MPNGDPDFHRNELPALEAFFTRLEPAIKGFADGRSLTIQRYYHQLPSWQLCFSHPKGGSTYVEVRREDDESFRLYSAWWIDDADTSTRSSRLGMSGPFWVDRSDLGKLLREHYEEVLAWRPGEQMQTSKLG